MSNTLPDDLAQQLRDAILSGLEEATGGSTTPPADPRKAQPVQTSDVAFAQAALVRQGHSRESAAYQVLNSPLDKFANEIAQEKAYVQQAADRAAAAAYDASPAGRAALAERLAAEQAAAATMDTQARTLLKAEGWADEDLDIVTAEERARAAGLIQEPTVPDTLDTLLGSLNDSDREFIQRGGDLKEMNR